MMKRKMGKKLGVLAGVCCVGTLLFGTMKIEAAGEGHVHTWGSPIVHYPGGYIAF